MRKQLLSAIIVILTLNILTSMDVKANDENASTENEAINDERKLNQEDYSAWIIGVGHFGLNSENAAQEGIGDSATFFKLGWEGQTGSLVYGVGIDGLLLSDKDSFNVQVENNSGDVSTAKSSAEAFGVYGELGYAYSFGNSGNLELVGGLDILSAERSVSNCSNCPSDNIDLDGGLYIEPRVRFFNESGFMFSISYRNYISDDIDGGLSLGFSWSN